MSSLHKTIIALFLAVMLASCNSFLSTPAVSQADILETAVSTVSTALEETQRAIPTATPGPFLPTVSFLETKPASPLPFYTPTFRTPTLGPTSTPLVFSDPSIPLSERIVYYYFVNPAENPIPEGTIRAVHLFAPTYADETFTSDTTADLRKALEIILHEDSRRIWESSDLEIVDVTFRNGHANVVLEGDYRAAGDAQPCAASLQILLTVFANPSVRTTNVTLNGGPIGNLCFFGPPTPHSAADDYLNDDLYTRTEIETYMKENVYVSP